MNELDAWTIKKMKCKDVCPADLVNEKNRSRLCCDNVSFKEDACRKCFKKETER